MKLIHLVLTSLLVSQIACVSKTNGNGIEVFLGFNVDIRYNQATSKADFTFVLPDQTWMGIVLGSQVMADSDIIQVMANGTSSYFIDAHATGQTAPIEDSQRDLEGRYEVVGNKVTFRLSRSMDTYDVNDYVLELDKTIQCAWAINRMTSNRWTKETARGTFGVVLRDSEQGRQYSQDSTSDEIPLQEFDKNTDYDSDG